MTLDHKALRATYDMTEMVAEDYRKFEPPLAQSDWFHVTRGMANALSVLEQRVMGEIDKEANQEVKAHGLRGSVLTFVRCSKPPALAKRLIHGRYGQKRFSDTYYKKYGQGNRRTIEGWGNYLPKQHEIRCIRRHRWKRSQFQLIPAA